MNFVVETADFLPPHIFSYKGAFLKLMLTHLGVMTAVEQELRLAEFTLTLKCEF